MIAYQHALVCLAYAVPATQAWNILSQRFRATRTCACLWADCISCALLATCCGSGSSTRRVFEVSLDGDAGEGEGQEGKGYTDVTVREAVEWTMGRDTEFTYIDVRSSEEHEKLATVRCALLLLHRQHAGHQSTPC